MPAETTPPPLYALWNPKTCKFDTLDGNVIARRMKEEAKRQLSMVKHVTGDKSWRVVVLRAEVNHES